MKSQSELDWLAFRYVAGEMTTEEAIEFESRMSDDLSVCEAVAAAVELSHAVALDGPTVTPNKVTPVSRNPITRPSATRTRVWLRRVLWMGLGALACSIVFVCLQFELSPQGDHAQNGELALAWASLQSQSDGANWQSELMDVVGVPEGPVDEVEKFASDGDLESELTPPTWMMSALENLRDERASNPGTLNDDASE